MHMFKFSKDKDGIELCKMKLWWWLLLQRLRISKTVHQCNLSLWWLKLFFKQAHPSKICFTYNIYILFILHICAHTYMHKHTYMHTQCTYTIITSVTARQQ